MLNVCRVAEAQDGAIKKDVIAAAETQEEAEEIIVQALKHFDRSGRNEEHHYWWGRNEGTAGFRFFIEGA